MEKLTLMLVKDCEGVYVVECPAANVRPGMVVESHAEYGQEMGTVVAVMSCCRGDDAYRFVCIACGLDKPYVADLVYAPVWQNV